jgi:hypothetical protein
MIDSNETLMYENGRDAGYLEGYADGLKFKIKTIDPNPNEAIVLNFNFEQTDIYEMQDIHEKVYKKFPNNIIIGMPDRISLELWSKDELANYVSMIGEIIEDM